MNSDKYELYMRSQTWKRKRLQVLERDNWQCRCCNAITEGWYAKEDLQVHHRHYQNLGDEPLEDLETLCPACHDAITAVHRRRRYGKKKLPHGSCNFQKSTPMEINHGISIANLQADGSSANHSAQWPHSKPARSVVKSYEDNLFKTKQNGCGS